MKQIMAITLSLFFLVHMFHCEKKSETVSDQNIVATNWLVIDDIGPEHEAHHVQHWDKFGKYVRNFNNGINEAILKGIDIVQSHAPDGGKYFTGIHAVPTESPVNYNLKLFCKELIKMPRSSSYCSGATYAAFIEALNILLSRQADRLSPERFEALRMQEPDGGRREDCIKFWGYWNADGFGNHFALCQYATMGEVISPREARPGDFANISWSKGGGHSVIFLGWTVVEGDKKMIYWSSQTGTNGYGDQVISLQRIKSIKIVRLVKPDHVFEFDINSDVDINIPGDTIDWTE
ncbi:hypothetical protein JXB12_11705 [candidate division KSB1 bacterium]|nr:hypothetical protein [candidate division KSB1 bacterium]